MNLLLITCCCCGVEMPDKITEAVEFAEYCRRHNQPVPGLVCDQCVERFSRDDYPVQKS